MIDRQLENKPPTRFMATLEQMRTFQNCLVNDMPLVLREGFKEALNRIDTKWPNLNMEGWVEDEALEIFCEVFGMPIKSLAETTVRRGQ